MAIQVKVTPKEGYKFVPVSQRDEKEENPFFVYVKPLGSRDMLQLEDEVVVKKGEDTVFLASGSFAFKVVQKSILGWSGIEDEEGKEIPLRNDISGVASEESVSRIPSELVTEISNAVSAISRDPSMYQLYFTDMEA